MKISNFKIQRGDEAHLAPLFPRSIKRGKLCTHTATDTRPALS